MSVFRSLSSVRIINGNKIETSESAIVSNSFYETNGEYAIVITGVDNCDLFLNSNNTDHVVIKSMTHVLVKADALIDEEFSEVEMNKGACVEFKKIGNFWYILSSDGMKTS
jgi:hypothetical protein